MGRTVPLVERLLLADKLLIGGCAKEGGRKLSLFCCYTLAAGLRLYRKGRISMKRQLSPDEERMRLAKWLSKGEIYDPRNEEDYDTYTYGTEPIPNDPTWTRAKIVRETNAA